MIIEIALDSIVVVKNYRHKAYDYSKQYMTQEVLKGMPAHRLIKNIYKNM